MGVGKPKLFKPGGRLCKMHMQVVHALMPGAMGPLAQRYCGSVNVLLRRDLHGYCADLRQALQHSASQLPSDPATLAAVKVPKLLSI